MSVRESVEDNQVAQRTHRYLGDRYHLRKKYLWSCRLWRLKTGKGSQTICDACQLKKEDSEVGGSAVASLLRRIKLFCYQGEQNLYALSLLSSLASTWVSCHCPLCALIPDKVHLVSPLLQQPWLCLYLEGPCSQFSSFAGKTAYRWRHTTAGICSHTPFLSNRKSSHVRF